jgi:hydrogenase expression/formation protein HypC
MCVSVPARIVQIDGKSARVQLDSAARQVLLLVDGAEVGDWVLVYSGTAIALLDEETAAETRLLLSKLQ